MLLYAKLMAIYIGEKKFLQKYYLLIPDEYFWKAVYVFA